MNENDAIITVLDKATAAMFAEPENTELRHEFYRAFLQATLFIPTFDEKTGEVAKGETKEQMLPLVVRDGDKNYMMLFDLEDRVAGWAEEGVHCLALPGHVVIEMATEGLHLALNYGCAHSKQFVPEEVAWLKQVVQQSKTSQQNSPG